MYIYRKEEIKYELVESSTQYTNETRDFGCYTLGSPTMDASTTTFSVDIK